MAASVLAVAGISVYPPGLQAVKFESEFGGKAAETLHSVSDFVFLFVFAVEHQVPAAARSCDFSAQCAVVPSFLIHFVDVRVADFWRHFLLVLPSRVEEGAEIVELALEEEIFHLDGEGFLAAEAVERGFFIMFVAAHLILNDAVVFTRISRVAEEEIVLELVGGVAVHAQRVHHDMLAMKLDEIEPAKSGGVLILHAALNTKLFALDLERHVGGLILGERETLELAQQTDQVDNQTGGGAKAGAWR